MKPLRTGDRSQLLSAYVDGELDESQRLLVEDLLSKDAEARQELEELRALKSLVARTKRLPASVGFWTRVSSEIERRKKEDDNLLPFPRRYFPLVAGAAAVLVVAVGILLYQQRASVVDYVNKQSELVQKAVGANVLKGSIMPLFSRVDKDQALQFAMFGTLPLDAKAETEFRVNEDSIRGYTIDVDKKTSRKTPTVTVKEFCDEVRPNAIQREVIDSLLDIGRRKLEGSVFVAEDKAMAIDPQLARYNRVMLSGIAATLEPDQRVRFEKFLRVRSAPYMISGGRKAPMPSDRILHTMRVASKAEPFVVLTPDTVVLSNIELDLDSLRRHFQHVEQGRERVMVNVNGLMRRIAEQRDEMGRQRIKIQMPNIRVTGDSDFISIQVDAGGNEMDIPRPEVWVKRRFQGHFGSGVAAGVHASGRDSSFYFNFRFNDMELDSVVERMMRGGVPPGFEFLMGDMGPGNGMPHMNAGKLKRALDSAVLTKKGGRSKLDSLMREMDKRERQRLRELNDGERENKN
jgi:hypothetical protein